jgi:tetratricopeptide (TPR) repeat protein
MASSARIDELRKKFDENPRRYFAPLANEYRKSGDPEQAIFICQEYLPQQPGHMSGHIVYGQALFELSRFDEAQAVFETALSLDPENLIALRHLGDIARQAGDSRTARQWYHRVLEADPRNEEIAQIMVTLVATPEGSVAVVSSAPSEADTPTLEMEPIRVPTPARAADAIEPLDDRSGMTVGPELSSIAETQAPLDEPSPVPPSAPVSTWSEAPPPSAEADGDLLDLDDFSVGGLPLSSLGAPPPAIEPIEPPPGAASSMDEALIGFEPATVGKPAAPAPSSAATSDDLLDLGQDEGVFEADPFAMAASPETPASEAPSSASVSGIPGDDAPIELASDIELGLIDDGASATTFSESAGERIADLETFGEAVRGAEEAKPAHMEIETFFAGMSREDEPLVEPRAEVEPFESHRIETPVVSMEFFESHRVETPVEAFAPRESHRPESPGSAFPPIGEITPPDVVGQPPVEVSSPGGAQTPVAPSSSAAAWTPPATPAIPQPAPSEEFVTETMAELYLEQGHPDAAVDIYQRLVAQRPEDASLREQLARVEAMLRGEPASAPVVAESEGPTIREFLASLLRFVGVSSHQPAEPPMDIPATVEPPVETTLETPLELAATTPVEPPRMPSPVDMPSVPTPAYDLPAHETTALIEHETVVVDGSVQESIDEDFGPSVEPLAPPSSTVEQAGTDQSVLDQAVNAIDAMEIEPLDVPLAEAMPASPPPPMRRETPGTSATVSGSIDALFSGAGASSADTDAAATLSQAFAPDAAPEQPAPTPPAPLQGVPAHTANSELSLDHVFKSTQARRPEAEGDGFSFDQFFADDMTDSAAKGGADGNSSSGKGGGPADDIAQFNNWLNGLKKT